VLNRAGNAHRSNHYMSDPDDVEVLTRSWAIDAERMPNDYLGGECSGWGDGALE
jgi:hypothetical protein